MTGRTPSSRPATSGAGGPVLPLGSRAPLAALGLAARGPSEGILRGVSTLATGWGGPGGDPWGEPRGAEGTRRGAGGRGS